MAHMSECITCVTIKITWNFCVYVSSIKVNKTVISHNLSTTHIHWCPLDVQYKESYFLRPGFWDLHFHSDVIDSPLNLSASRRFLLAEFGNLCLKIGETHDDANENSKFCDYLQASCKFSCIFLLIFATTLVFSWQKTLIFSSSSSHYRWYRWSRFWIHSSIEYSVFKKYRYLSINRFSATAYVGQTEFLYHLHGTFNNSSAPLVMKPTVCQLAFIKQVDNGTTLLNKHLLATWNCNINWN